MNQIADINAPAADVQSPDVLPHSIEAEQQLLGAILTNNAILRGLQPRPSLDLQCAITRR